MKKELVIIGAYPNTNTSVEILKSCILSLKERFDILLCTHYPANNEIQSLVDYYIYDSRNELIKDTVVHTWYIDYPYFYIQQQYKPNDRNYNFAVYRNIMNGVKFIDKEYDDFFYIEGDCIFDKEDVEKMLDLKKESLLHQKKAAFFTTEYHFFSTLIFWANTEYFKTVFPFVQSSNEFTDVTSKFVYPQFENCIEHFLAFFAKKYDNFDSINLLHNISPTIYFDKSNMAKLTVVNGESVLCKMFITTILRSENSDDIFFVYVNTDKNPEKFIIDVQIDDLTFQLENGKYAMYKQIFPSSNTIKLIANNIEQVFDLNEIKNAGGSFIRFK